MEGKDEFNAQAVVSALDSQAEFDSTIRIVRHKTPLAIMAAFFQCNEDELSKSTFGGMDQNGNEYEAPMADTLKTIEETGRWGFCSQKNEIHVYVEGYAKLSDIVALVAHERGHMLHPHHKREDQEEIKAGRYERVAEFAVRVALDLLGRVD